MIQLCWASSKLLILLHLFILSLEWLLDLFTPPIYVIWLTLGSLREEHISFMLFFFIFSDLYDCRDYCFLFYVVLGRVLSALFWLFYTDIAMFPFAFFLILIRIILFYKSKITYPSTSTKLLNYIGQLRILHVKFIFQILNLLIFPFNIHLVHISWNKVANALWKIIWIRMQLWQCFTISLQLQLFQYPLRLIAISLSLTLIRP